MLVLEIGLIFLLRMEKLQVLSIAPLTALGEYRLGFFRNFFRAHQLYLSIKNKEEFMSITAELWQAIKVPFTEVNYGYL